MRKSLTSFIATAALAALGGYALTTAAAEPPAHIKASYEVLNRSIALGEVSETYDVQSGKYRIESNTTPSRLLQFLTTHHIKMTSQGTVNTDGMRPLRYEEERGSEGNLKQASAAFDWEAHQVTLRHGDKTEKVTLPAHTQDRLSLLYHFMHNSPKPGVTKIGMATGRRVEEYEYRLIGEEGITTAAGKFQTLHLVRQSKPGETRVELWLAKDKHYFPVRLIVQEHDGPELEQKLTSLSVQ